MYQNDMQNAETIPHRDGLYRYAMAITRNPAEAEDLVQETYFRAIRAMGGLGACVEHKSWLFTILRNARINQLRRQRTALLVNGMEDAERTVAATAPDPLTVYTSKVDRLRLREAIQQLSAGHQEIIFLREYEELTYQELSGILNCPVGTIMSRLGRARARLRTILRPTPKPARSPQ